MELLEEQSVELPAFVPTKEDLQRLAILRAAGHITKVIPYPADSPPKYEQNTSSDKIKIFCFKCHQQFVSPTERKTHICNPVGHSWTECISKYGGFYGGHAEEKLRREKEKITYTSNKKSWDKEETARYLRDKKLWDWHLTEDRKKKAEMNRHFDLQLNHSWK
jgi:hypothetical protein